MNPLLPDGTAVPFLVDDIEYHAIATEDFSPSEDASLTASEIGKYMDKGFLVWPHADGNLYGITWRQYIANNESVTGLIPQLITVSANGWVECRFVKVLAANDGSYPSTCGPITVGIIV